MAKNVDLAGLKLKKCEEKEEKKPFWRSRSIMRTSGRERKGEHRIWDGMKWHVYHTIALFLIRGKKTAFLGFDKIAAFCCETMLLLLLPVAAL